MKQVRMHGLLSYRRMDKKCFIHKAVNGAHQIFKIDVRNGIRVAVDG